LLWMTQKKSGDIENIEKVKHDTFGGKGVSEPKSKRFVPEALRKPRKFDKRFDWGDDDKLIGDRDEKKN